MFDSSSTVFRSFSTRSFSSDDGAMTEYRLAILSTLQVYSDQWRWISGNGVVTPSPFAHLPGAEASEPTDQHSQHAACMRLRRAALLCLTPVKLILGYDDLAIAQSNLYHPPPADLEQMTVTSTFQHNEQLTADTNPKDVGFLLATTVAEEDAVVFTKTSLVQFLKLHGIQVDTNYTELKRLPK